MSDDKKLRRGNLFGAFFPKSYAWLREMFDVTGDKEVPLYPRDENGKPTGETVMFRRQEKGKPVKPAKLDWWDKP